MGHSINNRIIELVEALNLNTNEFAKELGLDRPDKIYNVVKNKTKASTDILELITNTFELVNGDWLLRGIGPMFKGQSNSTALREEIKKLMDENHQLLRDVAEMHRIIRDLTKENSSLKGGSGEQATK